MTNSIRNIILILISLCGGCLQLSAQTQQILPRFRAPNTLTGHLDPLIYNYTGKIGGPDSLVNLWYLRSLFLKKTDAASTYQPLENQRLSTTDNVTHNNINATGTITVGNTSALYSQVFGGSVRFGNAADGTTGTFNNSQVHFHTTTYDWYASLFNGDTHATVSGDTWFGGHAAYNVGRNLNPLDFLYKQKADSLYLSPSAAASTYAPIAASANYIPNNSTGTPSSGYTFQINSGSNINIIQNSVNGNNSPPLRVISNGSSPFLRSQELVAPNLTAGQMVMYYLGVNSAVGNNSASVGFTYNGSGSATNELNFGFAGHGNTYLNVLAGGNILIGSDTQTAGAEKLQVAGSTSISSIANSSTGTNFLTTPTAGGGQVQYRTSAQVLGDIGALSTTTAASTYEAITNKATSFTTLNNTLYPTTQAVANYFSASISGTINYLPIYTGSSTLGISAVTQSGGNVGIGLSTLTGAKLEVAGSIMADGSFSGYSGAEYVLNGAGADQAISTIGIGALTLNFDHRGTSNTGSWRWRNGTGASNTQMTLSSTGNLTVSGNLSAANIYSTSATPTITLGAGATGSVSIAGNNQDGVVTLVTTAPSSGVLATITMSGGFAYPNTCVPVVLAQSSGVGVFMYASGTATTWTLSTTGSLGSPGTFKWYYHNGGY